MKLFEQIRRAHERDGASIRELARRFGVHRRDVRAALASPIPPARKVSAGVRPAPKLDVWKPLIDRWLADDIEAPRKQRHTARRVWQRLVLEHGADVGESTVRRYVKKVKDAQVTALADVAIVQDHELGAEAEVDFGAVHVWLEEKGLGRSYAWPARGWGTVSKCCFGPIKAGNSKLWLSGPAP